MSNAESVTPSRDVLTGTAQYAGYEVTVIPAISREQVVKEDPYLSFQGRLGNKPSRSLGGVAIDQTNSIDPATGEKVPTQTGRATVSLGAKRPGVIGDIHSSRSGL